MAHLVFSDTRANTKKPKEPFLSNAPTESYKKTYEVFLQDKILVVFLTKLSRHKIQGDERNIWRIHSQLES